jgi:hypothetical protein
VSARPAEAVPLDFAALGQGQASAPPARRSAPSAIPEASRARGLYRVNASRLLGRAKPGFREFVVFDDAARAAAYEVELKQGTRASPASDTCFATSSNFRVPEQHDPRPLTWDTFSAGNLALQAFPHDGMGKIVPVRAERWVDEGGKASLETTLFWVDVQTGGTRLLARSTAELERVAVPFAGVSVHALRTGAHSVSFFVRREVPRVSDASGSVPIDLFTLGNVSREKFDPTQFRTSLEGAQRQNPCTFEHVDLRLREDPAPLADAPAATGKSRPPSFFGLGLGREPSEFANVVFAVVYAVELEPANAAETAPGADLLPGLARGLISSSVRRGGARARTMVVNLGLGRNIGDNTPVPSVSYRWLDRPRTLAL